MLKENISPVYLHTNLGRSAGANPFVEYRTITGQMGYSKNRRALTLYSNMVSAFLQQANLSEPNNCWYYSSLRDACEWLHSNPYLAAYHSLASRLLEHNSSDIPINWHVSEDNFGNYHYAFLILN